MTKQEANFKEIAGISNRICGNCQHCSISLSGNFRMSNPDKFCDKLGKGAFIVSTISVCDLHETWPEYEAKYGARIFFAKL